jgi:hypothetical protein
VLRESPVAKICSAGTLPRIRKTADVKYRMLFRSGNLSLKLFNVFLFPNIFVTS